MDSSPLVVTYFGVGLEAVVGVGRVRVVLDIDGVVAGNLLPML
jgi:hypothetical protein